MTPQVYCARLERALSLMPAAERQETIRYYLEFLEDASEEERAALGTPEALAQQILRENGIFPQPAVIKHSNRTAKLIVLACTFYIWLPLLVTWYSLLLTALIVLICIPVSLGATLLGGLFSFVITVFQDVPTALMLLGFGLGSGGVGILVASHLAGVQGHCPVHHIYHEKNAALCAERGRCPVKKRILVVAAAYGLVLLGWGATGSFAPWARSQTAAPAAVETIQLEHLSIRSGKSTSIRTADRCITKQRGTTLSVRSRLPLFPSDSDVTLTLKQALQTTERSN